MVVAVRKCAKEAAVLPIGEVVLVPRHVHAAQQSELGRVHGLFVDDGLSAFEEVVVIRSIGVLIEVDLGRGGHRLVNVEAVRVGDLLVNLVSHALEQVLDLVELLRRCTLGAVGIL